MPKKGHKQTNEHKAKKSSALKKAHSEGRHKGGFKIGNKLNGFIGKTHTDEWKAKLSEMKKLNPIASSESARKKISESRMGEKNHNWKGGVSLEKKTRYNREYRQWRKKVLERDNFTCITCGKNKESGEKYMTAHHIKEFGFYPELRYVVENGQTLCVGCHCKITAIEMRNNKKGKRCQ